MGPLKLDLIARSASRGERALDLLPAEFKLLEYLMRHSGQTVTRAMLLEDVWHYRFMPRTARCGASSTCLAIRRSFVPFAVPVLYFMRASEFFTTATFRMAVFFALAYRFRPRSSFYLFIGRWRLSTSNDWTPSW